MLFPILTMDNSNTQPTLIIFAAACIILFLTVIYLVLKVDKLKNDTLNTVKYQKRLEEENEELNKKYNNLAEQSKQLRDSIEVMRESRDRMERIAYTDSLTGFPNREAFTKTLEEEIALLESNKVIAVVDIDVDNFKNVNDELGYSIGDQMIIDVAHRLLRLKGPKDYLAKVGEDEFAFIVKTQEKLDEMEDFISKIKECFVPAFTLSVKEVFATASISIAYAPKDAKNAQILLRNINVAMSYAKYIGKNTHVIFNKELYMASTRKIEMQSELRNAIEKKQFMVYYQPQLDLLSGAVSGFEALLRWQHPIQGIIQPGDFIPFAEETGLIVPIGNMIINEVCTRLKIWEDEGYSNTRVAINISQRQFLDSSFVQSVKNIIETTKVNPERLEFEITEATILKNLENSIKIMKKIKKLGIVFVLEGFGTGYSSLNYLKKIPVSKIKIDKSFVSSVLESDNDQQLARVMILLAQNLELVVIAEGVERKEQELFLKKLNCDTVQGYYYSRPVNADDAKKLLNEMN